MACPITVSKFVGTVSLGLLTGLSYSTSAVTIPALKLLPTSSNASRCLHEIKRLNRKHVLHLSNVAEICLLFAYHVSPPRRQHPYMMWMFVFSSLGSYGLDFFFNRHLGLKNWIVDVIQDTTSISFGKSTSKKEEDLVVVESEEDVNGESVQREMDRERRMHRVRAFVSGLAMSIGIVGLWGDKK